MRVISVEADFHCDPLWCDDDPWNLDPREDLSLPEQLAKDCDEWAKDYDATLCHVYPPWSGFLDVASAAAWLARGRAIAEGMRNVLPAAEFQVVYEYQDKTAEEFLAGGEHLTHSCR